jgi:DNA-binding LacI/PurR family transcriptional regulator
LVGNGFYTNFGYGSDAVFASFSKNIRDLFCDYHFLSLPMTNTLQQNLQEIKNCLLDALLFIAPDERLIAVADHLINEGFPAVVAGCTWDSSIPALKYNYFGYDFAYGGICRARYFLENHCHKLVYCAQKNVSTESFRRFLNEAGVCFPESNLLQDAEQVGRVLPELLLQDAVDGIVCDGNARRYDQVFKILMASGKKDSVRLLVEDEPQAIVTLSKYPDLKADKIPHVNIVKTSELAGKKAALLLKKILTGKQVRKTEKAVLLK